MSIDVTSLYNRRADNRWDRCAVGDVLERVAVVRPDAEAIVGTTGAYGDPVFARLTYREADTWSNRFAQGLLGRGLRRGDRVMMLCENSVEALIAKIGIAKAGCVAVPVNPAQVPEFMTHAITLTEPRLLIADDECRGLADAVGRPVDVTITIGSSDGSGVTFRRFCESATGVAPELTIHGDDIWEILFTSGTTAMPKGVMISHHYSYLNALTWIPAHTRGLRDESQLRTVVFSPIVYHIGDQGWALPAFLAGGTVILGRGLKPARSAAAVASERATLVIGGGRPLAVRLLDELEALGAEAVSSLTCLIHGLGMLSADELDRLRTLRPGISVLYIAGQTESVTSHRLPYEIFEPQHAAAADTGLNLIGRPTPMLASTTVALDGTSSRVPEGELVYRSPVMTAGYYRDEDATRNAFSGGWFHSGDVGTTEPDGLRSMTGRKKDMIKTGGENVASSRVEAVVARHPCVAAVAVIGLPDSRWGEAVTAVVVAAAGAELDDAELIAFCRSRLPGYETPKRVIVVDELPTGFGGKILKSVLREQLSRRDCD